MTDSISGLTAIDTLYEAMGYRLGQEFLAFLTSVYLPAAVAIGGLCHIIWQCVEKQSFGRLAGYLAYLVFIWWLIVPVTTQVALPAGTTASSREDFARLYESSGKRGSELKVPRVLLILHVLTDNAVKAMVARTNRTFLDNPFGSERLASLLRQSGINDAALRQRFQRFLVG